MDPTDRPERRNETDDSTQRYGRYLLALFESQPPGEARTLEELKTCLEHEDEQRRVRDAVRSRSGARAEKARLEDWVARGEPGSRHPGVGYLNISLKRKYPDAYWAAVMERDRKIYSDRRNERAREDKVRGEG